ncbi:pentatricopeptide repeat-containing protein At1g77405 [Abrus precatorius]|uniref:Pentatricopeptide repeat-containing protein At1g77405 n=1 Tax=Abrus precatorius TaxID=3816 RepID=A0A8B8L5M6_ABRPR|nr:pentatricopeptide repeat-containing protein At1g77405 [Abrus precatorius]XP_027349991.1 pentatricopeptide repeat-containing protein At1g77405 [Abrus precatorius]XP_027349992.1 pentatricopeptide repeat-containing protein At1g77405 [Abrus precatorius]XP_027349993.1 pentatricopeptide repeat-containing protein At1g77405 [Abrus precatorius]XP_027349994.1 pentatricopeptide repeat-containing protein At1g77405 [Abrus precatorius]
MIKKPQGQYHKHLANQAVVFVIKDLPFDLNGHTKPSSPPWTTEAVTHVLRFISRYTLQSPRSMGRQKAFRHRTPLRQRNLNEEYCKLSNNTLVLGPAAHRDPHKAHLGPDKALEFFDWVEIRFAFAHTEYTCREMACVLARGNKLKALWDFLKRMSSKEECDTHPLVTTATITCLIKLLGEQGLANEALLTFHRMRQFRCKPDVHSYNTLIHALCRVGNFTKARFLLEQMELPGFRCPPDTFTYTILISSYCRHGMLTGCRKATRRRLYEAGRLFRLMLFKGLVPDVVTYNALIDGCCKTYRVGRAMELFDDMKRRRVVPNRVTYDSFIRCYSAMNEIDKAVEMLREMERLGHGVPSCSSYTPIIHALCEVGRVVDAWGFLVELVDGGSVPREYTYRLVCDALRVAGEGGLLDDEVHERIKNGIWNRYRQVEKVKPIMYRKGYPEMKELV